MSRKPRISPPIQIIAILLLAGSLGFTEIPGTTQREEIESGCDPYEELACPGLYDWQNCRCPGGNRIPPDPTPPVDVPDDPFELNYEVTRAIPGGNFQYAGGSSWHGSELIITAPPSSVDLALSNGFVDDFHARTTLRLRGASNSELMAGLMYDTRGPGGHGEGAVFLGKGIYSVLAQQLRGGQWVNLLHTPIPVNLESPDMLELVRRSDRCDFLFNGRVIATLEGFSLSGGLVEVWVGGNAQAAFGSPSVRSNKPAAQTR